MALSGPQALNSLDGAIRDIREEERDITTRVSRSAERIARTRENEAELFQRLANVRLEPAAQKEIGDRLSGAERAARDALAAHSELIGQSQTRIADLDETIAALARERHTILEDIDARQEELRAISGEIAQAMAADPDYEKQREKADALRAVANESLKKTEQAEADRESKGRPYRQDPLFMYLWEAGYGTRTYRANNLVRWADSMVARLVRFDRARPNFAMLKEIPLRLREHTERQIAMAEEAEARLDALEERAIATAGGGPIKDALTKAQARIEEIDAEMAAIEDERDQTTRELSDLVEGRDPAFQKATTALAEAMENKSDLSRLMEEARRTSTPEDDAILAQIDDARLRIVDEEQEIGKLRERLKVLAGRRRELEDIEWEFKKAHYDDPRSVFRRDDLTGDLLGEFLRGAITAATYWGHWQRSQDWRAGTSDWGGGFGLPRGGRSTSRPASGSSWSRAGGRGGFSRPRTGSRGSRKSGGFRTGGSF